MPGIIRQWIRAANIRVPIQSFSLCYFKMNCSSINSAFSIGCTNQQRGEREGQSTVREGSTTDDPGL